MATGYAPIKVLDDDGSAHFALMEVKYTSLQEGWKAAHPGMIWIIDPVSDKLVYINSIPNSLYVIKRFRTQAAAEKWLIKQGADYLTRADYEWLQKAKARKNA